MLLAEVHELIDNVGLLDVAAGGLDDLSAGLTRVTRLRGWLESRSLTFAARIREMSSFPEGDIAAATRTSQRAAGYLLKRSATATALPALAAALARGAVSGEHVDVVTRGLGAVEPPERPALIELITDLVPFAEISTPDQFDRAVKRAVDEVRRDDGESRLQRQKAAARLRCWFDKSTGMYRVNGELDPETGLSVHARIEAKLQAKHAEPTPAECPSDPGQKQDWLRAQALAELILGSTTLRSGVPETVVVVDTRTGIINWGFDVSLPASALQRYMDKSKIYVIDVHGNRIEHAPGELNLGRSTRLANKAQRRALRVLYATCAIPGCCVKYENTTPHHVWWWRHGGPTDLALLLPLCADHHARVHDGTITLLLTDDRTLTVTFSDGRILTTGPPQAGEP